MKDILTEMKNNLQGINNKEEKAKNQISNLDYKEAKNTGSEQQNNNPKKWEQCKELWYNFKHTDSRIMGWPEEKREQELENLFEKNDRKPLTW